MRRTVLWPAAALAAALALGACHRHHGPHDHPGPHGPHVSAATLSELPTPLPSPYDQGATAEVVNARIDAAFARASAGGKRVIVDLGGNWCGWCRTLVGVMELPEVKPFIDANFEVVPVDVTSAKGHIDLNSQVLKRFDVANVEGVPWLVVADASGHVLASTDAITDDAHQTPQAMVDWLAQWAKTPAAS